jgi:hypothetical protein
MIYLPCFIIGALTGLLGVDVLESILTTFYTCFADDPLALQKHDPELFSEFIEIWCARYLYTPILSAPVTCPHATPFSRARVESFNVDGSFEASRDSRASLHEGHRAQPGTSPAWHRKAAPLTYGGMRAGCRWDSNHPWNPEEEEEEEEEEVETESDEDDGESATTGAGSVSDFKSSEFKSQEFRL